jgi:hypothetical protein
MLNIIATGKLTQDPTMLVAKDDGSEAVYVVVRCESFLRLGCWAVDARAKAALSMYRAGDVVTVQGEAAPPPGYDSSMHLAVVVSTLFGPRVPAEVAE